MNAAARMSTQTALGGWRARCWALVLFLALLRGLVPHAALAGAMMPGDGSAAWCAPGNSIAAPEAGSAKKIAVEHACICAAASVALAMPGHAMPLPVTQGAMPAAEPSRALARRPAGWPPPARGPPQRSIGA